MAVLTKKTELDTVNRGKGFEKYPKFHWLKAPAIFLMMIGTAGILSAKIEYFESFFSFLELPPLLYSYIVTVLAGILLTISCVCKSIYNQDEEDLQDNWRSI